MERKEIKENLEEGVARKTHGSIKPLTLLVALAASTACSSSNEDKMYYVGSDTPTESAFIGGRNGVCVYSNEGSTLEAYVKPDGYEIVNPNTDSEWKDGLYTQKTVEKLKTLDSKKGYRFAHPNANGTCSQEVTTTMTGAKDLRILPSTQSSWF